MRRLLVVSAVATAWWTFYAFVQAGQLVGMGSAVDPYLDVGEALRIAFVGAVAWIPISIALYALVRRWPIGAGRPARAFAVLAVALVVVVALRGAYVGVLDPILHYWYAQPPTWTELMSASARNNALLAVMIIGVLHAGVHAERAQAHRTRIVALEAGLARARLDALAAQLNPHFLFNALNAAAELVHHDADAADRMLVALAALLRRSLARGDAQEVTLAEELSLLDDYLAIEKIRLGERLVVRRDVAADAHDALLPPLLLQPLVENAIVHGIARRLGPGRVEIDITRRDRRLVIEIADPGATDATTPAHAGAGVGLANTRERLRCLYGDDWSLSLTPRAGGGTVLAVSLPWRPVPRAADATPHPRAIAGVAA